ncbi:MAG: alpha/beta fold hydrolase [Ilumatobacteraceae bacterium]
MISVPSSDGVVVALHELAGAERAGHPVVLVAHATGFHGHAYLPIATRLAPRLHTFALDFRGHGDTPRPPDWPVDWDRYGDDAEVAAQALASRPGAAGGLIGFGHSMGGAGLLMAAARRPGLFRLLVVFEPIVFPSDRPGPPTTESPMVIGARRRRPVFDSFEAAIANYASKPPLGAFDPEALDAYVRFGLRPEGDHLRLKCEPEHEARTFEQGGQHATWDGLASIDIPVVVVAGRVEEGQPSAIAEAAADALPAGRFVGDPTLDHFGPFTHPGVVADLISAEIGRLGDGPRPL